MTLKDYTTEQLRYICSYKMTDFKRELEKRESIERAKSFKVFVGDCFYDEEQKCLYEITEVTDSSIHYNNTYLNISQIEQWDGFCEIGEIDFSKFTKIRKNIVDIINSKLDRFNRLVGEMHDQVYEDCIKELKTN